MGNIFSMGTEETYVKLSLYLWYVFTQILKY